ncbi:glycosyltransferase family 4 protein [Flocculibacter collagenilyticus]|uniref:glycosyltransferase family 4 protein n=1 Tax=Flocculibacter collagenilyticus TaxID=2744479 RepID=UPI0018F3DC15|nr:glycosyltransferase family 4 protein [Flocculibacter collagenilyticus]
MKILTITTLFPNNEEPKHGVFIRNRLRHLLDDCPDVQAKVIAPVPWFPIKLKRGPFAEYAKYVDVKAHEKVNGIDVYHPRYLVIPKIGMYITPLFLFISILLACRKIKRQGYDFELIDSHYFFPDGVATALAAKILNVPLVITARGTDIHTIPADPIAKRMIRWAANSATAVFTVCDALKNQLFTIAPVKNKTHTVRNGVNLTFFTPLSEAERQSAKQTFNVANEHPTLIASVGRLIELKGHQLIIEAMKALPECTLLIAGDGPEHLKLQQLIDAENLQHRVKLLGALSQDELKTLYQAADALVLASSKEGWANVLLEAMACGTPVVATNLWGTPEVVAHEDAGMLVDRTVPALTGGIKALLNKNIDRTLTRKYAEQFDWLSTSQKQHDVFSMLINANQGTDNLEIE